MKSVAVATAFAALAFGACGANAKTFEISPTLLSWDDAATYCEGIGGALAVIASETENNAAAAALVAAGHYSGWLAYRSSGTHPNFTWRGPGAGDATSYTNWHYHCDSWGPCGFTEPNNVGGIEDCTQLWNANSNKYWNDNRCNYGLVAICQDVTPPPLVGACNPVWGCTTNGMAIYDSAASVSIGDGLEFTKRNWASVWRNAVGDQVLVTDGESTSVTFHLDFLATKADFMVGLNTECDQSKVRQAENSPASIMYHGAGWIWVNGAQSVRIDLDKFYPRQGDKIILDADMVQGTVLFSLQSGANQPQPMHTPISVPIDSYYFAGSIKHVGSKIGVSC